MSRDLPPIEPALDRLTFPSTPTIGVRRIFTRASPAASQLSPAHNTDSPSPRRAPPPAPQRSSHSFGTLSPECNGGGTGLVEGENAGPYTTSQATIRSPSSGVGCYRSGKDRGGQSGGYIGGNRSRRSRAISAPSPIPPCSHPFDSDEVRRGKARDKSSESRLHRAEIIHGMTANAQIPIRSMREGAGPALTW